MKTLETYYPSPHVSIKCKTKLKCQVFFLQFVEEMTDISKGKRVKKYTNVLFFYFLQTFVENILYVIDIFAKTISESLSFCQICMQGVCHFTFGLLVATEVAVATGVDHDP